MEGYKEPNVYGRKQYGVGEVEWWKGRESVLFNN